ncbi:MAG: hypothetical protein FJY83_10890, partial [Candidatus Aminicenantes bacterium]|nr:hypothetical protein [Candidatus Aminicenantes bacterium]
MAPGRSGPLRTQGAGRGKVPDFSIERECARGDGLEIAGVDEAGRGCLFGPVV